MEPSKMRLRPRLQTPSFKGATSWRGGGRGREGKGREREKRDRDGGEVEGRGG